jgi:hypothetical protein
MAVIHDIMPAFLLLQPASLADARKLLEDQGRTPGFWLADSTASTGSKTGCESRRR